MLSFAREYIEESIRTKERLIEQELASIVSVGEHIANILSGGGKVLLCGNGGSAADAQHIAAELVIRYRSDVQRPALPAIALTVDPSLMTAGSNDLGFENVFAREIEALGAPGDVLIAISTSGKSENVRRAALAAHEQQMSVVGLLGCDGGVIAPLCDYVVIVPSTVTSHIQECHITIAHLWCTIIEERVFPDIVNSSR